MNRPQLTTAAREISYFWCGEQAFLLLPRFEIDRTWLEYLWYWLVSAGHYNRTLTSITIDDASLHFHAWIVMINCIVL